MTKQKMIVTIIFICIVLFSVIIKTHRLRRYQSGLQVISNKNECFVLMGVKAIGYEGNLLSEAFYFFGDFVGITPELDRLPDQLYLFHYQNQQLIPHKANNLPVMGGGFPFGNVLHYSIGGERFGTWRWTGNSFVKLSIEEAEKIRATYTYEIEVFARENWHEFPKSIIFQEKTAEYRVYPEHDEISLLLERNPQTDQRKITFKSSGINKIDEVLWDSLESWDLVSEETYSKYSTDNGDK